jgi:GDP/UDP-N,N'-diacetylbacillosamine 2-epimerase (hydrolysing)
MTRARRIAYITGTRADFGLMQSTLQSIDDDPSLELQIIVTGTHLLSEYGMTIKDIEASGLPVTSTIAIEPGRPSGLLMARNIARMLEGFASELDRLRPDLALLLGDRGEMLAGATAALHLNIPTAHIHGGERSGTVDEPIRHAISKLSHLHFVATEGSRNRLIRMGENPAHIHVTGAPGLDGLADIAMQSKAYLFDRHGLDPHRSTAMLLYHPVVQEAASGPTRTYAMLTALQDMNLQVLALRPNSDAGGMDICEVLQRHSETNARIRVVTHLPRGDFVSFLRHIDLLVGNSSSGIIEAASFGTPVVNIGSRQNLRERNANVIDTSGETVEQIRASLEAALKMGRQSSRNVYGDGRAGPRITEILRTFPLASLGNKTNAY